MSPRLLVVDDDPDTLQFLQLLLERQGYQVATATTGKDALAYAHNEGPDAVLLDMMMPDMDGLEICRRLRADEATAGLPILAVTARAGWDKRAEGLHVGIDDYITKPFDPEDLIGRLKAAVSGPPLATDRLVTEMMQALMVTLGCQLVWLLAADPQEQILFTVAIVSAPTEVRARRFVQTLRGTQSSLRISYAQGLFGTFMDAAQPRPSWPLSDLAQSADGAILVTALNEIGVQLISAIPIPVRGKSMGLLIYDAPRLRAESSHLATLATNVAAAALTNHWLIADLRRSEEKARAERAFRQMVLDTMGEGILVLDSTRHIEFVNHRLVLLTGFREDELVNQPANRLLGTTRLGTGPLNGTTSLETHVRRKDGTLLPAQIVRTPRPAGGGQVVVVADLSAEKRAQAELYEQNRRLDALIQATRTMTSTLNLSEVPTRILEEAVRVLDAEGGAILLVNAADGLNEGLVCAAATGPGTETLPGRTIPSGTGIAGWVAQTGLPALLDDSLADPRLADGVDRATGLKARSLLAVPMRSADGTIGVVELLNKRNGPFAAGDRPLLESLAFSAVVAIQNAQLYARLEASLKALAESQAKLVRAEKLTATGRMATMMAHEINNPLQSVKTALALATRPELPEPDRQRCLNLALSETERVTSLLQRMLEMHRPSKGERGPVELPVVAEKVLALAEPKLRQNEIEVVRDWPEDVPTVMGIADQVTQVLLNLVLNACDALGGPGRLTIRFQPDGDSRVVTEVTDNGPGIPPDVLVQIFEPFFTTKSAGTGLGLAVSHDIVERHGGRLDVTSEPGNTVFRFSLPR